MAAASETGEKKRSGSRRAGKDIPTSVTLEHTGNLCVAGASGCEYRADFRHDCSSLGSKVQMIVRLDVLHQSCPYIRIDADEHKHQKPASHSISVNTFNISRNALFSLMGSRATMSNKSRSKFDGTVISMAGAKGGNDRKDEKQTARFLCQGNCD